nr:uncharacterized protein LOC128689927 [Cherax quadricarinatus]
MNAKLPLHKLYLILNPITSSQFQIGMLTSNYQRISLFLCTFSNFVNYEADANQLLNDGNLSQQLYTKINGLKSAITDYEYNEDMHKWVLDEEEIYVPNRMTHQTSHPASVRYSQFVGKKKLYFVWLEKNLPRMGQ